MGMVIQVGFLQTEILMLKVANVIRIIYQTP